MNDEGVIPKKGEKYMKTVVAFANGSGGKIVFGIEDRICKVIGIMQEDAFTEKATVKMYKGEGYV